MKNLKEKMKNTNGITLVALVVTIIVLLILAAVSLSAVFSQDGIFSRAEQATGKYGQAKARETLELAFSNLQAEKYEARLTASALDTRITEEIGKMGGEEIGDDKSEVIVDGYRFLVDRTVPKIVEELGAADGVIISASITQNGDWQNPKATVTGLIKTYSGGTITSSTAEVTKGNANISSFPTTGGNFTIADIAEDTDIKITATDSNKKTNTRTIHVVLVRDNTPPVISNATATANMMKITISADAADPESNITSFTYNVTGAGTATPESGKTFTSGVPLELTTDTPGNYTVTFTATNGAGKSTTTSGITVTTTDTISVADAKRLVNSMSALKEYVGTKVDYKTGETWQIFYYDEEEKNEDGTGKGVGYFGPKNTLYLKKAFTANDTTLTLSTKTANTDPAVQMMRRMNPKWASSSYSTVNLINEKACVWLCDTSVWNSKRNSTYSSYAIGSPSVEMYMKAFNVYKTGNKDANNLVCKVEIENGYSVGANGSYSYDSGYSTGINTVDPGLNNVFAISTSCFYWLASPATKWNHFVLGAGGGGFNVTSSNYDNTYGVCPVVPLDI